MAMICSERARHSFHEEWVRLRVFRVSQPEEEFAAIRRASDLYSSTAERALLEWLSA
jgi:hypothetical protein